MNLIRLSGIACSLYLVSCTQVKGTGENSNKPDILATNRDTTTDPSVDFFTYANGGWIKNHPIPDDQSSWGIGNAVQEELYNRLKLINEQSLTAKNGIEKKVGDFWYSAMDTVTLERQKLQAISPELHSIDSITDVRSLAHVIAQLQVKGINNSFSEGVYQDAKNSDVMAYYLNQGGLGLPNRDYYFKNDQRNKDIRTAYARYVTSVFELLGADSSLAQKKSAAHIALETKLAEASRKLEDLRDPYKNYNKFAVKDLGRLAPSIDWPAMLSQKGVKSVDSVIVGQPEFYKALEASLKTVPLPVWQDYLRFHVIRSSAPYLDSTTYQQYFTFYGKTLRGAQKPKARWKRMLDLEDNIMGEALGRVFVTEYFDATAKKRYENMVEDIRTALKDRIEKLDWMSDSTKQKALHKLAVMKKKVGYPEKWKDFSAMDISRQPLVRNVINANIWWNNYEINKLGKPVDREEWDMNPQTYNAYYNPSNNEIVLPAGIFTVPGYRDEELDDALVYGYAGATTIGHEITHGFDDEGRQFDEKGNLKNWWTPKDSAEFAKRAEMMVKQFNDYVVVDSMHINGKATLGENIADLGGLNMAYEAFTHTKQFKEGKKIDGLTPQQRFFLGWAQVWRNNTLPETSAQLILTDPHSPGMHRANGPLVNIDAWYQAFNVQPGDKMYKAPDQRIRIW